jgi:modulator of FtsH protease HflC
MSDPDKTKSRTPVLRLALLAIALLLVAAFASCFLVNESERVIVLRFGKPVREMDSPGLFLRWPMPVERVVRIDRRLQHADTRLSETLTRDQRNVIVPVFFTWRVSEALKFHTSVRDHETARRKLEALVISARNTILGRHDFADLVGDERRGASLPGLEAEMLALAAPDAGAQLGIELVSTGITQVQLPQANTESVFRRMRAERKREATQYRAEGRAKAAEMKAEADKEATGLIAEAKRQAEEMRGRAEAEAARLYAGAHGKDPAFYRFLRELQSLRTVVDKNTTVVLDSSVAPFHWLKEPEGQGNPVKPLPPATPMLPRTEQTPVLSDGRSQP